jgi:hypothetical protein
MMLVAALAWLYVVVIVALVEATGGGTVLGAVVTFLLYGLLPLAILGYLFFSPARRRLRRASAGPMADSGTAANPDGGGHPAGAAVTPEREEA